jgi:hypothetical protein
MKSNNYYNSMVLKSKYLWRTDGILILFPSKQFSTRLARVLPTANPDPLSV